MSCKKGIDDSVTTSPMQLKKAKTFRDRVHCQSLANDGRTVVDHSSLQPKF